MCLTSLASLLVVMQIKAVCLQCRYLSLHQSSRLSFCYPWRLVGTSGVRLSPPLVNWMNFTLEVLPCHDYQGFLYNQFRCKSMLQLLKCQFVCTSGNLKVQTEISSVGFFKIFFKNALHLYLKNTFLFYRWKWKAGSKNSLQYCERGQWNHLITMKIIAMRSQSSYVMGQLTLRWNLMKNVKLKEGNLLLCSVRFHFLFVEEQFMFQCARNTSSTPSMPFQFLHCPA